MRRTEAVVIGGGQAGLAMSRCLAQYGIDHVVLERGRVGERWRSERWDSLRLLSPNWQTRLPGFRYDGPDPDGYMQVGELVGLPGALRAVVRRSRRAEHDGAAGRGVRSGLPGDDRPRRLPGARAS